MSEEKQIEEKTCKKCIHYEMCLEKIRKAKEDVFEMIDEEEYFAHADECNFFITGYRKQSEGEWISNRQTDEYICSLCGAIAPVDCLKEDFYKSEFCPNCGAKMKGGAE